MKRYLSILALPITVFALALPVAVPAAPNPNPVPAAAPAPAHIQRFAKRLNPCAGPECTYRRLPTISEAIALRH